MTDDKPAKEIKFLADSGPLFHMDLARRAIASAGHGVLSTKQTPKLEEANSRLLNAQSELMEAMQAFGGEDVFNTEDDPDPFYRYLRDSTGEWQESINHVRGLIHLSQGRLDKELFEPEHEMRISHDDLWGLHYALQTMYDLVQGMYDEIDNLGARYMRHQRGESPRFDYEREGAPAETASES